MSDYLLPAFLAVLVHLVVVIAVLFAWAPASASRTLIQPPSVSAHLVVLEPEAPAVRPAARPAAPRPAPTPATRPAPKPAARPAPRPAETPPAQIALPAEPTVDHEAERRREARERLADAALELALASETESMQAAQAARSASELAQSYAARITRAIEQNWIRPPSARNGMRAELVIDLVPTGEVVAVNVASSSGDPAFDRSAERAVRRLGRLEVPEDPEVFETYFRRLRLMFQPEDLMR